MTALFGALAICVVSAGLEGLAAGRGVRQRFTELHLPRFSPPLPLWIVIGFLYYAVCFFISYRLLSGGLGWTPRGGAFALLLVLMTLNVVWNVVFFRRKNLRASYFGFWPYLIVAVALLVTLWYTDVRAAWAFVPYVIYSGYATWWGYRLWQLNNGRLGAA
jgi:tryptophan-rich sensory protein